MLLEALAAHMLPGARFAKELHLWWCTRRCLTRMPLWRVIRRYTKLFSARGWPFTWWGCALTQCAWLGCHVCSTSWHRLHSWLQQGLDPAGQVIRTDQQAFKAGELVNGSLKKRPNEGVPRRHFPIGWRLKALAHDIRHVHATFVVPSTPSDDHQRQATRVTSRATAQEDPQGEGKDISHS